MPTQTPSRFPIGYSFFWVAIFVVIFTDGLNQAFAAIGIAAIVAFFACADVARVNDLLGNRVRS